MTTMSKEFSVGGGRELSSKDRNWIAQERTAKTQRYGGLEVRKRCGQRWIWSIGPRGGRIAGVSATRQATSPVVVFTTVTARCYADVCCEVRLC